MKQFHVAGWRSGAGKTTLACAVLEAIDGWGALKTSTHPAPSAGHGPPGVVTDLAVLAEPGSDTARYLAHGAARVAWLRATPETLERDLPEALRGFEDLPGVLVEGNSPWAVHRGDRLVLVVGRGTTDRVKRSAAELARDADLAILDRGPGCGQREAWLDRFAPEVARLRADLGSPDDAGRAEAIRRIVTWSRA